MRGLDISGVVAQTEYERLMTALNEFLEENETSFDVIADSDDQLAFTAAELDIELLQVRIAADALALSQSKGQTDLSHELLYGIGRQSITLSWATLHRKTETQLRAAIVASVEMSIISALDDEVLAAFLKTLQERIASNLLEDSGSEDPDSLAKMLSSALPKAEERLAFLRPVNSFEGTDYAKFWAEHLSSQREFGNNPKLVAASASRAAHDRVRESPGARLRAPSEPRHLVDRGADRPRRRRLA